MMDNDRILRLFDEIEAKTKAKRLGWQEVASSGVYVAPMGGKYTLRALPYTRGIANVALDEPSISLVQDQEILATITGEVVLPDRIADLYALIKRQVDRIEEKLQSMDEAISLLKNL